MSLVHADYLPPVLLAPALAISPQWRMPQDAKLNTPARLMLIDDHVLFRTGMRLILGDGPLPLGEPLEAGSIAEALTTPHAIDVVLLDVELPGISGIDGLALIKRRWPHAAIVMLTANDDPERMRQAMQRGAHAFVSKTASAEHIRRIVQQALAGKLQHAAAALPHAAGLPKATVAVSAALSARQLDVLTLMCEGLSNKAVANRLFLSENTVRNHVVAVLRHFDASTRTEAVTIAQRTGVIRLGRAT